MAIRIQFSTATVKALVEHLQAGFDQADCRVIKRVSVLLAVARQEALETISATFQVGSSTIYDWLHSFIASGMRSLSYQRPPGRPAKLTKTQKSRLREVLLAGSEAAGFVTACWTSRLVQAVIEREFGVRYSVHYVTELLHNLGFSFQKARFVADHLDPKMRTTWLTETWPQIVAEARQRQALLLFVDEASFAQWGSLAYTWALRGQQPCVPTCGKRKNDTVFGAVEYFTGRLFTVGWTERLNADSYCIFLALLLAQTTQPLILVQDNARYHVAAATRDFLDSQATRLTVYQLPPYSPDYNPIEHVWKYLKQQTTHNRSFATFAALQTAVDQAIGACQQQPARVKRLVGTALDAALGAAQAV
jgi:transposase